MYVSSFEEGGDYVPRQNFKQTCATFLTSRGISVVYGAQGRGKTTAIMDIMKQSLDNGVVCGVLFARLHQTSETHLSLKEWITDGV